MKASLVAGHATRFLDDAGLSQTARLVVGVSGGVDSMVLLHILSEAEYQTTVVHVNYGLRGPQSDADEAIVTNFCMERDIPCEVFRPDKNAFDVSGKSLQEGARDYRYQKYLEVAASAQSSSVVLGHHADDNAETILHNLFRGTGLEGLAGIPASRAMNSNGDSEIFVLRPLLDVPRSAIANYAETFNVPFRVDASNTDESYERGFFRSSLRPLLEERYSENVFPNIAATGQKVAAYLKSTHLSELADLFADTVTGERQLSVPVLESIDKVWQGRIVLEALRQWHPDVGRDETIATRIIGLVQSQPGREVEYPGLRVVRERETLAFVTPANPQSFQVKLTKPGDMVAIRGGSLRVDVLEYVPENLASSDENIAFMTTEALPLTVRTWRNGDRMTLFGGGGTKKVSDILTDAKVPSAHRDEMVVVESDNTIVWIPKVARSDDYKIAVDTSQVLIITYIAST